MKNIAIINGIKLTKYAFEPVVGNKNSLQCVYEYTKKLPHVEDTILLLSAQSEKAGLKNSGIDLFKIEKKAVWDVATLLTTINQLAKGFDNIFYLFADCPLLDSGLAERMLKNHIKYFADYTFADGYPYGLSPEIIKPLVINPIIELIKNDKEIKRDTIFELIKKDINSFDLETELSPVDLRLLRVSLSADSKRNFLLLNRVIKNGAKDESSVIKVLTEKADILRTLPSYFSIQIVEGCLQACSYCPYPLINKQITSKKSEIKLDNFNAIIKKIEDFCGDATISISLWGEPALHSRITDIINRVMQNPQLDLIIETSGLGWNMEQLLKINSQCQRPPHWIVSLDAFTEDIYKNLRGNGFKEAVETAERLIEIFKQQVYVQAVRIHENEDNLEHFYKGWKKKTDNVIIQKYDYFCGFLTPKKVTDLSPLKRFPCWHIKRDMSILIDGSVPLCREDLEKKHILGNILSQNIESIWQQGQNIYLEHLKVNYPGICKDCDEYYTYNF